MSNNISRMKELLFYNRFIVVDTETTGFSMKDPYPDELTEIGAVKVESGEIIDTFDELIKPHLHDLNKGQAVKVTGITDEMVENCDGYIRVLKRFYDFCNGPYVLVMHNASFDLGMLQFWGGKMQLDFDREYIDTLKLSKEIFNKYALQEKQGLPKPSYKLQSLAHAFNIPDPSHHRASNDAIVTWKLLQVLRAELLKKEPYYNNIARSLAAYQEEKSLSYLDPIPSDKSGHQIITSVNPWHKGDYYRLYIRLSRDKLFSDIYYDFTRRQWGIKEALFNVDFDQVERDIAKYYQIDNIAFMDYDFFEKKKYEK